MADDNKRLGWLDSLRAFAISLVVIGHIAKILGSEAMHCLYRGIYLFHMPLFFVMSGVTYECFTLRNEKNLKKLWKKRTIDLLFPAFCFAVIAALFDSDRTIFTVYNAVWYLPFLALIISEEIFCGTKMEKNVIGGVESYG